jgi:hypothetical protein
MSISNNRTEYEKPLFRKDILHNMLSNKNLKGLELFELIMRESSETSERRQGWIYESVFQILVFVKCIEGISYTHICDGQLQNLNEMKNIIPLMKTKVEGGGNNIIDLGIKLNDTTIVFSVKYKNKYSETDVCKIDNTITSQQLLDNDFKIGILVKNRKFVENHKYKNDLNIDKEIHDRIMSDGLLFDEADIIRGLDVFCSRFSDNVMVIDDFVEHINSDYLNCPRQQLIRMLHQDMTLRKFINIFELAKATMNGNLTNVQKYCISQMPRSGKSILMLLIAKYLLSQSGYKRILLMTSVCSTIKSFVEDLNKWIDFKGIQHREQTDFDTIDEDYEGIVFCSCQFLKIDGKTNKADLLKQLHFDAMIIDEAHLGSSTEKTNTNIINGDKDIIDNVRQGTKLCMFVSGTADKTKRYYNIHNERVYEWQMIDVAMMKLINNPDTTNDDKEQAMSYMVNRHGDAFVQCLEDNTLNKDYSNHPTQVLMKHTYPEVLIREITEYNSKYGTDYGLSASSLLALQQKTNSKGELEYVEKFELEKTNDGIELLIGFFELIISSNRMKTTIMKTIEQTQATRGSRISSSSNPLLSILYLPINTRNGTISKLQKTLVKFLAEHNLWNNYNIEYANSTDDTGFVNEEYDNFIQNCMNNTKKGNKRGCILLLGNKGSVGVTYHECDVTISLDDGHNLDNQIQRFSRALTPAAGKTVGINVDMNVQRSYVYMMDMIHRYRKTGHGKNKTNAEILYYMYEKNVFLFNPQEFNNGNIKSCDIQSYFQNEATNMIDQIDDTIILDGMVCDDDMKSFIKINFQNSKNNSVHSDLEGEQQHCPKGGISKTEIDGPNGKNENENENETEDSNDVTEEEDRNMEIIINQTLEMCKTFLFPLLALISRSFNVFNFKEIFTDKKTTHMIISILVEKIDLNNDNYNIIISIMNNIIDNNVEIVNNVREIYSIAPAYKLRRLIEQHFIPSASEKKDNAEVPTPVILVDDMLNKIPNELWTSPHQVFEPCCGKGNFVLAMFDNFYHGLKNMYPDEIERCHIIMTECIYYADLTELNVFITTELLKCHIQSYCGLDELDYKFNSYVGDTLKFDFRSHWNIEGFNRIIGNPPYNSSGATATGNTIWQDFTRKALNDWLCPSGQLLFVHPPGWRKPNTDRGKFTKMFELMTKENQMTYLEIHGTKDGKKTFNCGTRYDWYLIEKIPQYKDTTVTDEHGKSIEINLSNLSWLPNSNVLEMNSMLAKPTDERCSIMQSMSAYEPRKNHMSSVESSEFKYKCVHSTPKKGVRYMYSNVNNRGHFGVSKVIFGDSGIYNPIIDMDGDYGMTHHAMAISVDNLEEATSICKAIESDTFGKIIQSCLFSSYAIDWNIFKEFKKDFWKQFI